MSEPRLTVIGGGLAGSEAALTAAARGVNVTLVEMRPGVMTPAHRGGDFGELVCSNSLKSDDPQTAAGLLKAELRLLGSALIAIADRQRVAAGGALAVDRDGFSGAVTAMIRQQPRITAEQREAQELDWTVPTVIAAGPLAGGALVAHLAAELGAERAFFYDAIAPVVELDSITFPPAFRASRYDKGGAGQPAEAGGDYINLPMDAGEYRRLREAMLAADQATPHAFEEGKFFEACLPVEEMAKRGEDTLRFGPLKPVGLRDPRTGQRPHAVVQVRQDDRAGRLGNLVGFQTRLRPSAQEQVLRLIPGLEQVRIARPGGMHRNTYFDLTGLLAPTLMLTGRPGIFVAGQLAGGEGYTEAIACGWLAGENAARHIQGGPLLALPGTTALGSLARYISTPGPQRLAPMHVNFGLLDPPAAGTKKSGRREEQAARALADVTRISADIKK